jgi:hypothetical protein
MKQSTIIRSSHSKDDFNGTKVLNRIDLEGKETDALLQGIVDLSEAPEYQGSVIYLNGKRKYVSDAIAQLESRKFLADLRESRLNPVMESEPCLA